MDRPADERANDLVPRARPETHIPVERLTVSVETVGLFQCPGECRRPAQQLDIGKSAVVSGERGRSGLDLRADHGGIRHRDAGLKLRMGSAAVPSAR
jgi:hypothetical protein